MIRVVLVDDEPLAIQELEYILSKVSYVKIVRTFTDALEALSYIRIEEPDVVFMDIDMPQMTGIQLTEQLKKEGVDSKVIYATAYDTFAIKAFDQSALDYLLKPYDADRIFAALLKVKHASATNNHVKPLNTVNRLPVWVGEKMILINVDEILFCSVESNRTKLQTEKSSFILNEGLSSLE